jgi:hypothetical protein
MNESLRPMTVGEILDRTAQLYRGNFLRVLRVSVLPAAVIVITYSAIFILVREITNQQWRAAHTERGVFYLISLLLLIPLHFMSVSVFHAALARLTHNLYLDEPQSTGEIYRTIRKRFGRYLWLLLLQSIFVLLIPGLLFFLGFLAFGFMLVLTGKSSDPDWWMIAFLLAVLTGSLFLLVWQAARFGMGSAVCVIEDKKARLSLKRSVALSRGTQWRIGFCCGAIWLFASLIGLLATPAMRLLYQLGRTMQQMSVMIAAAQTLHYTIALLIQAVFAPVISMLLVLFYYDQRVRKEGYDIEWMMRQAGLEAPPVAAAEAVSPVANPPFELAAAPDSVGEQ